MSTSDWLGSDEDDHDGSTQTSSPPPSSSSSGATSSCREPPTSCLLSTAQRSRWRRRSEGGGSEPVVSAVLEFTSVCSSVSVEAEPRSNRKRTHKDEEQESDLFSHKCAELQCYIQPLSSILQGLRSGRYSERLSSFQESVAMDRIQRIMGVLQNPGVRGHFLSIILKIEEMLHSWFPHVIPSTPADDRTHAKKLKQHRSTSSPPSASSTSSSPIFSLGAPEAAPCWPSRCSSSSSCACLNLMQDNAVSSSTDSKTGPLHLHRRALLPLKVSSPCLERLLQAKDSIITCRTDGDGMQW